MATEQSYTLHPQEHEVWLTIYKTVLTDRLADKTSSMMPMRAGEKPSDPCAVAADRALEAYRKTCAP